MCFLCSMGLLLSSQLLSVSKLNWKTLHKSLSLKFDEFDAFDLQLLPDLFDTKQKVLNGSTIEFSLFLATPPISCNIKCNLTC